MEPNYKLDEMMIKNLSKLTLTQNVYMQFADPKIKGSATTIIPVELKMEIGIGFRRGIGSIHGPT